MRDPKPARIFAVREHEARVGCREQPERIVELAQYLPDKERILLEMIFKDGRTFTDVARIAHTRPRVISHRVKKLLRRINTREFRFMVSRGDAFDPADRVIMHGHFVRGVSYRELATLTGRSLHDVRKRIAASRAIIGRVL